MLACLPVAENCQSANAAAIEPCCTLEAPPALETACTGVESTENPASCGSTGIRTSYRVTSLEVAEDCNEGYDLDGCNGQLCGPPSAPSEGIDGVDNGIAVIEGRVAINQLFSDALCGRTHGSFHECAEEGTALAIELAFEWNSAERCVRVEIVVNRAAAGHANLNLSDATASNTRCVSGRLGMLPLSLGNAAVVLRESLVRMTVSEAGFSDGLVGAMLDSADAAELLDAAISDHDSDGRTYLDSFVGPWCGERECNALSGTYRIGGVAMEAP